MIIQRKENEDPDGSLGYVETIYESSNVLMSTYFPKTETLYLSFSYGQTYKYMGVSKDIYIGLEKAESQGKYFNSNIKNNPKISCQKAYKLMGTELNDAKGIIQEWKNQQSQNS